MSGKGDKQIKAQVPWQQYSDNWDKAVKECESVLKRINLQNKKAAN